MKIFMKSVVFCAVLVLFSSFFSEILFAQMSKLNPLTDPTVAEVRDTFQKGPGRDYASSPLWVWNDLLTEEQIRGTLQDLAGQGVKQAFVHPRPGLMTPYLSDDWFRLWRVALDEAEKLDMNIWIYDENSYPSGFAGGLLPEQMPEARGKGLFCETVSELTSLRNEVVYVVQVNQDGSLTDRTTEVLAARNAGEKLPALTENGKEWFLGRYGFAGHSQWYGGQFYVDLMKPGVTEKFIEITHERYLKELGEHFGKRLPGLFTDEPQITPAGGFSWTDDLPQRFEEKFGYSLIQHLPLLSQEIDNPATGITWRQARHNYHALLLELFITRWSVPNYEFCEKHGLEWTGHYWEHGWPGTSHGPDNMAMYAWHQRPAIDLLMNTFHDRSSSAQFGNIRSVKELASVVNQMGHSRTLSENYGAGGWDIRFEDLKRLGDWSYVLGVNTMDEHLSYITIRGARKHDHPQSFSYHASWWPEYKVLANYFTRLSYMLSQGKQVNRVLILEPTTTAWMYQNDAEGKLGRIAGTFTDLVFQLEARQAEYDLGSEDILARVGRPGFQDVRRYDEENKVYSTGLKPTKVLKTEHAAYDLVVLPEMMENINLTTLRLLAECEVRVILLAEPPLYVDGVAVEKLDVETRKMYDSVFGEEAFRLGRTLKQSPEKFLENLEWRFLRIISTGGGKLYHHCRQINDGEILFLCNASMDESASGILLMWPQMWPWKSFREYDLMTGKTSESFALPSEFSFEIPPAGSLMYVFSSEPASVEKIAAPEAVKVITGVGEPEMKRLKPNVLVLDYMDVETSGETRKNEYFYRANQFLWNKNGFPMSPWDNGVQLRDTLLTHEFAEDSAYAATYHFTLKEEVPDLRFVCERGDLYEVTCNGKPVAAIPGAWYLDKSFAVYDLRGCAKPGENEVRIACKKMNIFSELMTAYVIGDFSLEDAEHGYAVKKADTLRFSEKPVAKVKPDIPRHTSALENVSWLSAGVDFDSDKKRDLAPWIEFTFETPSEIAGARFWNYCEISMEQRGIKKALLIFDGDEETQPQLVITPARGKGDAEMFLLTPPGTAKKAVSRVKLVILENHNGLKYPLPENFQGNISRQNDSAFVGLAEIQFLTADGTVIPVKSVKSSSELASSVHSRRAIYAVNGAGLGDDYGDAGHRQSWKNQGMPFYADTVAYTQTFRVTDAKTGVWKLRLPKIRSEWWGSVAKVVVNGKEAGVVAWSPCEADVSALLKEGENEISVILYGTPKNLFGPHHAGAGRGSAWPGMFHGAPAEIPEGGRYDTIDTGIFKPFVLIQYR